MGNTDNLIPTTQLTESERRAMAIKAGKASGEARRKYKIMSGIYAKALARKVKVKFDGKDEQLTGAELIEKVLLQLINTKGTVALGAIREIRLALDGQKIEIDDLKDDVNPLTPEQRDREIDELLKKRAKLRSKLDS